MNTILKRFISIVLCFVLVAGYLPVGALAEEMDTVQEPSADTTVVVEEEAAEEESEDTSLTEDDENTSTVGDVEKEVSEEPPADEEAETPSEGDEVVTEEDVTEDESVTEEPAAEESATEEAVTEETASIVEEVSLVAPLLDADETVIDAAIFCSDVHGNPSTVTSVFNGIKSADSTFNPSTASFVGDTQCTASSVTSAAQSVYSGLACYYAFGNHDDEDNYGIDDVTGLLYGSDTTNYYIYAISENDMSTSSPDTSGFTNTVAGLDKSKPLFIISHMPLHSRRGDNNGAAAWYDAISAAAEQMDIAFFWAHNHTSEGDADRAAYYVAKDGSETITVQGGSTVTPNFTYANAGYIDPPNTPQRNNVATAVRIYDDSINYTVYNASGELSGTYAVNETVSREFAGSSDSGETETVTLESIAVTAMPTTTVYNVGDTFSSEGMVVTATYSDGSTKVVTTDASLSDVDMTTAGTKTVTVTYGEENTVVETTFDITVNEVVADDAVLTGIEITTPPTTLTYEQGSQLNLAGMVVTATFEDGTTAAVTDYEVAGYDADTLGEQTITVSYTHGEGDAAVTKTATFTVTVTEPSEEPSNEVTVGGTTTTTKTKTVYVLTSSISSGNSYLIANSATAGSVNLVANDDGDPSNTSATVVYGDSDGDGDSEYYIELDDATNELWTVGSGYTFKNGSHYLYPRTQSGGSLELRTSSRNWSYSNNHLSYTSTSGGGGRPGSSSSSTTYYLRYNNGWTITSSSSSASSIYFYVPTEVEYKETIDTTVNYTMRASDLKQVVSDNSKTGTIDFCLQGNGADLTTRPSGGGYSFNVLSDEKKIIDSIGADGTVNFTGTTGTATVKVAYTWTQDGETYTVYKNITVEATEPYYELDLHKAEAVVNEVTGLTAWAEGTTYYTYDETTETYTQVDTAVTTTPDSSVTYYYVTYELGDEITAPIAIKGIEEGDQYGVWAVVKYYDGTTEAGTDMGAVGNDIEWSSSDESIATVDPVTGIITFTGKEGTVNITATYKNGNKPSDTITISVTQSQYSVPADGTNDFPEYPNEGAIRYDKTATAVGNFSETGIAQIELSMTGVPYTTGSEIDVVLMLDMTGSMSDTAMVAAEEAAVAFVAQIVKNEDGTYNDNRVAVYAFNSGSSSPYELVALSTIDSDSELATANTAIRTASNKQVSGGTPYDEALEKCQSVLAAAKADGTGNDRQQFCVFMSDGGPTSYEYITNYDAVKAGTATSYTTSTASATGGSNQSDSNFATIATYTHEYYSTLMKDDGVTMFSVLTGLSADDYPNCATIMENIASSSDNAYVVENGSDTSAVSGALSSVAQKIMQAATDVTVEDQITDEYTMIFDIPTDTNYNHSISTTQEFYIEFLKYTLDSNHERVDADSDGDTYDDATSITKLYLIDSNGDSAGGTYSAGSTATTAYAAPTFENKVIGDKGTLYYWTTDSGYASKAAVQYSDGTNTYYFIPYGIKATDDGYDSTKWFNMTSGAYANGTIDSVTNTSTDLVIATPYFVYNAKTKMLYWTVDKLDTEEYALRYFLYLDNSATDVGETTEVPAATYPTNDHAYITYTNFRGNGCQQKFPIPQLTWNGAQVSYVFYLVNSAGQPINKSGQVVDFANATFITDVYTTAVVWNKGTDGQVEGDANLSVDWLAAKLLPSDYLLYDVDAGYELKVYADASGETIFNYFTIEGSTAAEISSSLNDRLSLSTTESTVSVETTKVYNTKAGTKYDDYGTYTSKDATDLTNETILTNFDFSNSTVAFAVVWQPRLVPDAVVVDYGLDVLINVVQNDLMQNTVTGIGTGNDAYEKENTAMNTGVSASSKLGTAALTIEGNTISIENENAVRFHQGDMEFTAPVKFYYESPVEFYESSDKKEGYMYSSVTVIPATTIYYEDEFVELTVWDNSTNEKLNEEWKIVGTTDSATQDQDRPGESQISGSIDADNVYGYDGAYTEYSTYSLDSARKIRVDDTKYGEAQFTFYGTGFDVISLTSNTTGTITVDVYNGTNVTYSDSNRAKSVVVDTYYGYKQESGDADGDGTVEDGEMIWVVDPNANGSLYQVPVIKVEGLDYGQYTVVITAAYYKGFDHTESGGYDFYLDAIRIYDPTGNQNPTANDAYVADGEGWPTYFEVRNEIIDKATEEQLGNEAAAGIVFIDGAPTNASVSDYTSYGPNNETYLAAGQAIAFELNATAVEGTAVAKVQLAVKTVGDSASIKVYSTDGVTALDADITTATDMYYDITDLNGKTVVIKNDGASGILSITNVKVTYTAEQSETETTGVFTLRRSSVDEALETLNVEEEVPETTEPTETEPSVPETTEPVETEPSTPESTEPEETTPTVPDSGTEDTTDSLSGLVTALKNVLKNLFGRWFS